MMYHKGCHWTVIKKIIHQLHNIRLAPKMCCFFTITEYYFNFIIIKRFDTIAVSFIFFSQQGRWYMRLITLFDEMSMFKNIIDNVFNPVKTFFTPQWVEADQVVFQQSTLLEESNILHLVWTAEFPRMVRPKEQAPSASVPWRSRCVCLPQTPDGNRPISHQLLVIHERYQTSSSVLTLSPY